MDDSVWMIWIWMMWASERENPDSWDLITSEFGNHGSHIDVTGVNADPQKWFGINQDSLENIM